ncbi:AMP-binding protein [Ferrimicrobium sp.]|uniref:AMP-binding protein n=1 Tax=Ferrimicrobium sp. TaxID=2926050 RepID=UPI002628869F|nr:AMP-binding protein [Ferrimicrobium sp.]
MSETLVSVWQEMYQESPSKVVIDQPYSLRQLTAEDLFVRSELSARRLATMGCAAGDRVAIDVAEPIDFLIAHLGVLRLGAISVPVPKGSSDSEIRALVRDCSPAVVLNDHPQSAAWGENGVLAMNLDANVRPDHDVLIDGADADSVALMLYTSGTTGKPKGVPLSHRNLLATARSVLAAWEWSREDSLLLTLPLHHMHGLGVGIHGTLCAGATAVALERFDVGGVIEQVRDQRATMFFGVPTMYARLLSQEGFETFAHLRLVVSGSAPLSAEHFRRITEVTGHEPLERYGMSETGMITSNPYRGHRRAGSVGKALPGVTIRLSGGDEGEILVRGEAVFRGYWQREEATREAFTSDQWFRTGDLGTLDQDGYLMINGRAKELIIKGGQNVFPREVECCLEEMDGIVEAAVIGEPDAYWGERIVAVLVTASVPIDQETVRQFVAERLSRVKVPDEVRYIEELPRNRMGKIQRELLRGQ